MRVFRVDSVSINSACGENVYVSGVNGNGESASIVVTGFLPFFLMRLVDPDKSTFDMVDTINQAYGNLRPYLSGKNFIERSHNQKMKALIGHRNNSLNPVQVCFVRIRNWTPFNITWLQNTFRTLLHVYHAKWPLYLQFLCFVGKRVGDWLDLSRHSVSSSSSTYAHANYVLSVSQMISLVEYVHTAQHPPPPAELSMCYCEFHQNGSVIAWFYKVTSSHDQVEKKTFENKLNFLSEVKRKLPDVFYCADSVYGKWIDFENSLLPLDRLRYVPVARATSTTRGDGKNSHYTPKCVRTCGITLCTFEDLIAAVLPSPPLETLERSSFESHPKLKGYIDPSSTLPWQIQFEMSSKAALTNKINGTTANMGMHDYVNGSVKGRVTNALLSEIYTGGIYINTDLSATQIPLQVAENISESSFPPPPGTRVTDKFAQGGFVFEPKEQVAELTFVLDFTGMYPSIGRVYSISPENFLYGSVKNAQQVLDRGGVGRNYALGDTDQVLEGSPTLLVYSVPISFGQSVLLVKETKSRAGDTVPVGGILPFVWKKYSDSRAATREKMEIERDRTRKNALNLQQLSEKLLGNAIYGLLGDKHASDLAAKHVPLTICSIGRYLIQWVAYEAEQANFTVHAGCTDSVMLGYKINSRYTAAQNWYVAKESVDRLCEALNRTYLKPIQIIVEKIRINFRTFANVKNRHMGLQYSASDPIDRILSGAIAPKIGTTGLVHSKRQCPPIVRTICDAIVIDLCFVRPFSEIARRIAAGVRAIKSKNLSVDSCALSFEAKEMSEYVGKSTIQYQLMKQLHSRGGPVIIGKRYSYYVRDHVSGTQEPQYMRGVLIPVQADTKVFPPDRKLIMKTLESCVSHLLHEREKTLISNLFANIELSHSSRGNITKYFQPVSTREPVTKKIKTQLVCSEPNG